MPHRHRPSYRAYEKHILGDTTTPLQTITSMVRRSFSALTFAGFWRYWNPFFAYHLYYWVYAPLVRVFPRSVAVILTFAISGMIHDIAASIVTTRVFILLTPVFAVYGLLIVIEEAVQLSFAWAPIWLRVIFHAGIIMGVLGAGIMIRRATV